MSAPTLGPQKGETNTVYQLEKRVGQTLKLLPHPLRALEPIMAIDGDFMKHSKQLGAGVFCKAPACLPDDNRSVVKAG
eukprot:scaffold426547_cov18-Prasinocladus_malaysianus.AAC.1